jgi:serine/threonine protein kinase
VKPLIHKNLGRYRIEAEIGRGAMGVVYRARDPQIDRWVAIKTISLFGQEPVEEQEYRERFLAEARAAGRLSHPGIVTVFDAGEDPETREPYLVMEYITGQPLSLSMAGADRRLPLAKALGIALQVAEALDYAHSQGVIHRDITPTNILITEEGHAKVTDFGVARLKHAAPTPNGLVFGTPAYMAPEQWTGSEADSRSDLFSLGVVLYSMITGFRPFQGNSAQTLGFKVMNAEPLPATSFAAELPPALDHIINRALAKDPHERYQTGGEMADEIRQFLRSNSSASETTSSFAFAQSKPIRAQSPGPTELKRRKFSGRSLGQFVAPILAVACAMTGWQLYREYRKSGEIPPPSVTLPLAPVIQKTPAVVSHRFAAVHRPSTSPQPHLIQVQALETAKMHVEILHHFNAGKASIWLDGDLLFDQELRGDRERHPIFHKVEMNQVANFELVAGKHKVEVRVVAPESAYDQREDIVAEFNPGPAHILAINCDKRKMQVSLH